MIATPWDLILTVVFLITGVICLVDFLARHAKPRQGGGEWGDGDVVDINHAVMSAAMILMIWVAVIDAVTWAQVVLFAIFAVSLVISLVRATRASSRVDLAGHIMLNGAMAWMLAAMPLLMAGMDMGDAEGAEAGGHHGGGEGATFAATPAWADTVNLLFVIACGAYTLWWLYRAATTRGHRLHAFCHALMAAGMGVMLWLMNV